MSDTPSQDPFPWPPASATGVGSLPGADPAEAMRLIFGELPDLPHLAELPGRGPGADLIGRTAALLVDLPVETAPGGWRFTGRPGRDLDRARTLLSSDLDALEEAGAGYRGPVKIQVCGPWTLAATIELGQSRDVALADAGAVADVVASLSEAVAAHAGQVRGRLPGAQVLVQFDEPGLPAVLGGDVPSASGLNRFPPVPAPEVAAGLRAVADATGAYTIVHCCAPSVPFDIIRSAGVRAVGFDLAALSPGSEDGLAEAVEAGLGVMAGVVPTRPERGEGTAVAGLPSARAVAGRVIGAWRQMGWPGPRGASPAGGPGTVSAQVVVTPACGLAGAVPGYARAALARCREAARLLPELIEEGGG